LPLAVEYCSSYEKIFICGGQAIYKQALEFADKIELTLIHKQYEGDTFFPEIDSSSWSVINTEDFGIFSFITYVKRLT
jgi:dihydrofolate reductase